MGIYKQIYDFVKRLNSIIFNLINQLHAVFRKNDSHYKNTFKLVNLYSAIDSLAKALSLIYSIDAMVKENENLRNHW